MKALYRSFIYCSIVVCQSIGAMHPSHDAADVDCLNQAAIAANKEIIVQERTGCVVRPFCSSTDQPLLEDVMSSFGPELDCTLDYVISYTKKPDYVTETLDFNGKPSGFVNYSSCDPENLAELKDKEPHGFLHLVAINSASQGKGLGKYLCTYIVDKLRSQGVQKVMLYVKDWNQRAQKLYFDLGFTLKRIDAPEQCLLLELHLA